MMNLGLHFTSVRVNADVGELPAALRLDYDLADAKILTAAECTYVASLEMPIFAEEAVFEPRQVRLSRLVWYGLAVLIVLAIVVLTPLERASPKPNKVLRLHLQAPSEAQSSDVTERLSVGSEFQQRVEPAPTVSDAKQAATKDVGANAQIADNAARVTPSIAESKAAVLQAWSDTYVGQEVTQPGPHQGQGTVFDAAFNNRLSQIEPGRVAPTAAVGTLLADVNGVQEVVIGDKCFQVSKLDDQAMRGMGVWTRGLCAPPGANEQKIKIGVLP
ncbi:hypothetical protein R50072_10290 [Simiduia litorea]|uniref:hypothetical protein n=1 Tax=Simiduia litorea TaxID=1435348 RepID=UPI0036F196D0